MGDRFIDCNSNTFINAGSDICFHFKTSCSSKCCLCILFLADIVNWPPITTDSYECFCSCLTWLNQYKILTSPFIRKTEVVFTFKDNYLLQAFKYRHHNVSQKVFQNHDLPRTQNKKVTLQSPRRIRKSSQTYLTSAWGDLETLHLPKQRQCRPHQQQHRRHHCHHRHCCRLLHLLLPHPTKGIPLWETELTLRLR